MKDALSLMRSRRSVRTFAPTPLTDAHRQALAAFGESAQNPFGIPVAFRLQEAGGGLTDPVTAGVKLYAAAKVKRIPYGEEAFGFAFEHFCLYALSLGIGTVMLGGTLNRPAFERAVDLAKDEMLPCVTPLGYPADKMSLREQVMRRGVKADSRLPFEALFFRDGRDTPLTPEAAGPLFPLLEAVRLAPSAVNKQPWRVVVQGNSLHFYRKGGKGVSESMQKVDMGIALCHFALAAEEAGLPLAFSLQDPRLEAEWAYTATYTLLPR